MTEGKRQNKIGDPKPTSSSHTTPRPTQVTDITQGVDGPVDGSTTPHVDLVVGGWVRVLGIAPWSLEGR